MNFFKQLDFLVVLLKYGCRIHLHYYSSVYTIVFFFKIKVMIHSEPFVRAMVVTSWRSGSTLTGELLNSLPGSFYSYEPLSLFGINRIYNDSKHVQSAMNVIKGIFECDYTAVNRECTSKKKKIWLYIFLSTILFCLISYL